MAKRSEVLELAVLGLLHDSPMHGYELRKRLNATLGSFRAFSYGSLYPCLREMQRAGWIRQSDEEPGRSEAPALTGRRGRIVYLLTAEGKERLATLLGDTGPASWEDEQFGVHFAFFAKIDAEVRLSILEGRRSRLEERRAGLRTSLARTRERLDAYTTELQRHGLESVDREVRWLNELIASERASVNAASTAAPAATAESPPAGASTGQVAVASRRPAPSPPAAAPAESATGPPAGQRDGGVRSGPAPRTTGPPGGRP